MKLVSQAQSYLLNSYKTIFAVAHKKVSQYLVMVNMDDCNTINVAH